MKMLLIVTKLLPGLIGTEASTSRQGPPTEDDGPFVARSVPDTGGGPKHHEASNTSLAAGETIQTVAVASSEVSDRGQRSPALQGRRGDTQALSTTSLTEIRRKSCQKRCRGGDFCSITCDRGYAPSCRCVHLICTPGWKAVCTCRPASLRQ